MKLGQLMTLAKFKGHKGKEPKYLVSCRWNPSYWEVRDISKTRH